MGTVRRTYAPGQACGDVLPLPSLRVLHTPRGATGDTYGAYIECRRHRGLVRSWRVHHERSRMHGQ